MSIRLIKYISALSLIFALGGCAPQPQIPIPTKTANFITSSPNPTNIFSTATPRPQNTPTIIPTSFVRSTLTPEHGSVSGWLPIPEITHPDVINLSIARSFKGLKIPPLPAELVIEFNAGMPYGEVPPETIFYQLYLIRKGNTRMLWLGIPFKETFKESTGCCVGTGCCKHETPLRIYDSIPFPPIEANNLLIPFICRRSYDESDIFLIVVAEQPEKGASATNIRYAWRIDQETTSLKSVSVQGIECSPNW